MQRKYYTMTKCPACGYDTSNRRKNISQSIRKLLAVRGRKTIMNINKIAKQIITNVPQDDRYQFEKFLFGIKEFEDSVVNYCINDYYESRVFEKNKGFAYLKAIIRNQGKNNKEILENERRRLGSVPPIK